MEAQDCRSIQNKLCKKLGGMSSERCILAERLQPETVPPLCNVQMHVVTYALPHELLVDEALQLCS